jgi:NADPH-dependent ferric siderophore reductase
MADEYHRVFVRIEGEEKHIMIHTTDLKHGLQSMWLSDMDKGWTLLESRLPALMAEAMEKHEADKARALALATAEYLERHPPTPANPLKAFIGRNYAWVAGILALVMFLRPDLIRHLGVFLF